MLILIALVIGGFIWWRSRRSGLRGLPLSSSGAANFEETIPLATNGDSEDDGYRQRKGKGKERATGTTPREEIFGVGELDEEDRTPQV